MLQAASFGAQALDSATKRARDGPPVPPSTDEPVPEEGDGSGGKPRQVRTRCSPPVYPLLTGPVIIPSIPHAVPVQKTEGHPPEGGQTCLGCNATSTPEWRRGPMGV